LLWGSTGVALGHDDPLNVAPGPSVASGPSSVPSYGGSAPVDTSQSQPTPPPTVQAPTSPTKAGSSDPSRGNVSHSAQTVSTAASEASGPSSQVEYPVRASTAASKPARTVPRHAPRETTRIPTLQPATPAAASKDANGSTFPWTLLAIVAAALLAAAAIVFLRRRRPEAHSAASGSLPEGPDPVEAELQRIIEAETAAATTAAQQDRKPARL
jgi:hypothetical protein